MGKAFAAAGRGLRVTGLLLLVLAGLRLASPDPASAQQIWFGPRVPDYTITPVRDWSALFKPTPEWDHFAAQFQVFLVPTGFVRITPDDELRAIGQDMAARHIVLALGLGAIAQVPGEKCGTEEGYGSLWESQKVAEKLLHDGVRLTYLMTDAPVLFGHYDTGAQGCQLPIPELARRVNVLLAPFLKAFPDLIVGDVEGVQALAKHAGWQATFRAYKDAIEPIIGRKLTYLQADINWRQPDWPQAVKAAADFAHAEGMKFGPIYDSDGLVTSDAEWVARAKRSFEELESRYGLIPEQADFDTWNNYPTHVFPETSPSAHSYLIAQYRLPRTRFAASRNGNTVQGQLLDAAARPVPGATVTVAALGLAPTGAPPARVVTGTVPAKARFALLGLRVNADCLCAGDNNLVFGDFTYTEDGTGGVHETYSYRPQMKSTTSRLGNGVVLQAETVGGASFVHAVVRANQNFGFNSPAFAVTPGASFTFKAPLGMVDGRGLFGGATLIWLGADHQGVSRTNIRVDEDETPAGTATTDASGHFALTLPAPFDGTPQNLLLHYAGSTTLRGAYRELP